jgi:hypothetical protein|tara:strand:+ start:2260 stop:3174 length:915 start_codon:yes stop_codon:yes gene_type:complete
MVTYRTGPVLLQAINAVLDQSVKAELILVNNGNPPGVVEMLTRISDSDSRFKLISGHGNIGFAAACNRGAEQALGATLLFLNPDCLLEPDSLKDLKLEFAKLPDKSLLGSDIRNPDLSEQSGSRRRLLTPWLALVEMLTLYRFAGRHPYFKRFKQHQDPLPSTTVAVAAISGAFMAIRQEHYWSIAGMDEAYFFHVEDLDFCLRFHLAGGKIFFCPKLRTVHVKATSEVSWIFVEWYKARGLCHYFRKHFEDVYPVGFISLLVCGLFIRLFVKGLLQALMSSSSSLNRYGMLPNEQFPPLEAKQ